MTARQFAGIVEAVLLVQKEESNMLTVGDKFPQFKVKAACGITNDDLKELTNESFQGKWKVFFFYPKDFTFVCPTEIVEFDRALPEFASRNAAVIGGSALAVCIRGSSTQT